MVGAMASDLNLRCQCGKVRGTARGISPRSAFRIVCYCDDCQAFARFLERPRTMNDAGGTEIVQVPPSHVVLADGLDQLRCVRLSEKGLHRFYAACCRTGIANTISPKLPFVGLLHSFIELEGASDAETAALRTKLEEAAGASLGIHGRFAIGAPPPGTHPKAPLSFFVGIVTKLALALIKGKNSPNAFYGADRQPRCGLQTLTHAERAALVGSSPTSSASVTASA